MALQIPNPLTGTMAGENNKAWAGAAIGVGGAKAAEPILEWLVRDGMSRGLDVCCTMPIPDVAQTGLVWFGLAAFGYLVAWAFPSNR